MTKGGEVRGGEEDDFFLKLLFHIFKFNYVIHFSLHVCVYTLLPTHLS